jgi:hypothetical protein
MPKITVHGGPSNAATDPSPPNPVQPTPEPSSVSITVDGVDQGPGEVTKAPGGPFLPLPQAVDGEQVEQVSVPDYERWTAKQLREVLADRQLPTDGLKADLVARLREAGMP